MSRPKSGAPSRHLARLLALLAAPLLLAAACDPKPPSSGTGGDPDASTSPNASIFPAPLVTEPPEIADAGPTDAGAIGIPADSAGRLLVPEAGAPPPEVLRGDTAMTPEALGPPREMPGVTLEAVWRWRDVPAPPKAPEVSGEGIKEAQKLTALTWKVDLIEAGRMRVEFTSRALPLPARSELRARPDRYGTVVLWPNLTGYRVIPPGALRTTLGERRVDVTPVTTGTVRPQGDGKRLGLPTRKVEITSTLGSLKLEIGKTPDVGEGGALFCRALVEIAGVDPKTTVCQPGEVPLSATYAWQDGGGISLEVTAVNRRTDIASGDMLAPPPGLAFTPEGLPTAPDGIFLTRDELQAFRTAPTPPSPNADPSAPGEGFIAANQSDTLMYLLVDGVPVVAVPAHSDRYVIGPHRGRYVVQWRTFLGERIGPGQTVEMPARLTYGITDGGAPDGGG
jgi:hypothetical protein